MGELIQEADENVTEVVTPKSQFMSPRRGGKTLQVNKNVSKVFRVISSPISTYKV